MRSIAKYEPYLYLLPAISILCIFLLFPFVWNIYISTHGVSITTILKEWEFVWLDNYIQVLNDPNFHTSIKVSIIFAMVARWPEEEDTALRPLINLPICLTASISP